MTHFRGAGVRLRRVRVRGAVGGGAAVALGAPRPPAVGVSRAAVPRLLPAPVRAARARQRAHGRARARLRLREDLPSARATHQTRAHAPMMRRRRCAFCPERVPRGRYRAHLERRHAALVFHCAECDRYLSRRVLLLHMTAHAAHYDAAARDPALPTRPPSATATATLQLAAALQTLLSRTDTAPPVEPEPEITHTTQNNIKDENAQNNDVPPAPSLPATPRTRTATTRSPKTEPAPDFTPTSSSDPVIVLSAATVPTPATASSPATVTASLPETSIAPTGVRDEFSDRSDAESDFGPLPDSVFSAIEDPPDVIPPPAPARDGRAAAGKAGRERERACPHCGKKYSAASSYFYHLKHVHRRSREHACAVCGATFGTRGTLREHARLHSTERPLACARCGKRFRSKAGLYIHSQTHGGAGAGKPWQCGECGRAFRWRAALRRHAARHGGARAHVCPQRGCARAFTVRGDLLRHARTHAPPHARLACPAPACSATFAQPRYLRAHLARKHPTATPTEIADDKLN
ncbi:uncharacterized protein isoform X2 [Choristoneura fumiferana]|uniref:uncharacterized protein isoform X2 n=1 Tax=Choristoneura fumiferana TaxID=7141 RepID=UPI003D1551B6